MKRLILPALIVALASAVLAQEIDFVERFALASDRAEALRELVPGTDDYYYYHALNAQNEGQKKEFDKWIKLWMLEHKGKVVPAARELLNRQAMLDFDTDPDATYQYIQDQLHPNFYYSHISTRVSLPAVRRFNPADVSGDAFLKDALRHDDSQTLYFIRPHALELVADLELTAEQRRSLLGALSRPDYPGLVDRILADLDYKGSRGFGHHKIHRHLTIAQLDELLQKRPALRDNSSFIETYLSKLAPHSETVLDLDADARRDYYERVWAFVQTLEPAHNSLKANVLYNLLRDDQKRGTYNRDLFLAYIQLPRDVYYLAADVRKALPRGDHMAYLTESFSYIHIPPVHNEEPLVRDCLLHFLASEDDFSAYTQWLRDDFLQPLFAEAKITSGAGDPAKWATLISPEQFRRLKDRVDIDFSPANPDSFDSDAPVQLTAFVKNVPSLMVKIFEINTLNYLRETGRPLNLAINLDGLTATVERRLTFKDAPELRVARTLDFPELSDRGTFVVELIGNGKSSRALVQKGRLDVLQKISSAGHAFSVLDENQNLLPDARAWLGGREFTPDSNGSILIPFSTRPRPETLVVYHGNLAAPVRFDHIAESYQLEANAYVDAESLLRGETAVLVLRPALSVAGQPVSLALLESPQLTLTLTGTDGIPTEEQINLDLDDADAFTHEFNIPESGASLSLSLSASVQNLSQNRKDKLSASDSFHFNQSDATAMVRDLHLGKTANGYFIEARGKNGAPHPGIEIGMFFSHRDFKRDLVHSPTTDANGRIELGHLPGITAIRAVHPTRTLHPSRANRTWQLPVDTATLPSALHAAAGETIRLPLIDNLADSPSVFSLLERRGNRFVRDWNASLSTRDGFLEITDLPPGDFSLFVKPLQQDIPVRVTRGKNEKQFILSPRRALERPRLQPLQITGVKTGAKAVEIQLANASPHTRVHFVATRYLPPYDLFAALVPGVSASLLDASWTLDRALYESGRDIGDEYRYILDRQSATRFYGNMLERPGLLLNPWVLRDTEAAPESLRGGGDYRGRQTDYARSEVPTRRPRPDARTTKSSPSNLDFLAQPAVARWNLKPDKSGKIRIPLSDLNGLPHLRVIAADPLSAVLKHVALDDSPVATRELRQSGSLDPATPYAEQKIITPLHAGQSLEMGDIVTATVNRIDTVEQAWRLLHTLLEHDSGNRRGTSALADLQPLAIWHSLSPEKRLRFYSDHASHEVNLFLHFKDPAFFNETIRPYLQNKKDKTFMDLWLLGADLSAYLEPWRFARLNAAEKALLAQRLPDDSAPIIRLLREQVDILPPNPADDNARFDIAMQAGGLSAAADSFHLFPEESSVAELEIQSDALSPIILKNLAPSASARGVRGGEGRLASKRGAPSGTMGMMPQDDKIMYEELMEDLSVSFDIQDFAATPYFDQDTIQRQNVAARFFQKLDKTKEWAENNYYHLPIEAQTASLITPNAFWADFAANIPGTPFLSKHLVKATGSPTEMLLALAVSSLPFEAPEHAEQLDGTSYTLTASQPTLVIHREIREAAKTGDTPPILVAQHFFRADDRYRHEDGRRHNKTVENEFLPHVVYGAEVVLTNPQGGSQSVFVLLQIPEGAMPVQNGFYTKGRHIRLDAHATETLEYFFYFPETGTYPHYPATVAQNDRVVAAAKPLAFNVVPELTDIDRQSWAWVANNGTTRDVINYLEQNNIPRIQSQLPEIAWCMRDHKVFKQIISLLKERHIYDNTLWSFGLYHKDPDTLRVWLEHSGFAAKCGLYLDSPLLSLNPVERLTYQHLEYSPLVNPRVHPVGSKPKIHNATFRRQYETFMKVLSQKPAPTPADQLAVAQAMLMQDRIAEAADWFARVDRTQVPEQLQYDYIALYLAFYRGDTTTARKLAQTHANHPVNRWRVRFQQALAQLDEAQGATPSSTPADPESREHTHDAIVASEPSLELLVEAGAIRLDTRNIPSVTLNFYPMDIELLFSRNPFLSDSAAQFAFVRPALVQTIALDGKTNPLTLDLPKEFRAKNVMVEALGAGLRKTQGYYANTLKVSVVETYGQLTVSHAKSQQPVPGAYVKVYARMNNGETRFIKDGYTDLRGRFDYASLNTNELDHANRLAILILADDLGALVREAKPPKQ